MYFDNYYFNEIPSSILSQVWEFLGEMQSFQGPLKDFKTMTADILIIPLEED